MKITIYDLLEMVKNGKPPKKIKVTGTIYDFDEETGFYWTQTEEGKVALGGKLEEINLLYHFNDEKNVEIIEENKMPEKLEMLNVNHHLEECYYEDYSKEQIALDIETLRHWINKLIGYIIAKENK